MLYYITYSFIYSLSLLPLSVLYLLSDTFALILYYIIRYRRDVVRKNLIQSFPEKSTREIIIIEKQFYRFFMQWMIETLKLASISPDKLKKHCTFTPQFQKIFHHYYREKKDIVVLMGHLGNWEWAGAVFNLYFPQNLYVLYHPLSNKTLDKIMKKIRSRFGTQLIPMQTALKHILEKKEHGSVFTFIADQCPSIQNAFWMKFLNQNTPVYYGPEKIIQKIKAIPVVVLVYSNPTINKKGYYIIDAIEIKIKNNSEFPVMTDFMNELELAIQKYPSLWLWSHKRWKYKPKIIENTNI